MVYTVCRKCTPNAAPCEPPGGPPTKFELCEKHLKEEKEKIRDDLYPKSAEEWLKRWHENHIVWSINLSGMGRGYEQCCQVIAAEFIQIMIDKKYDASQWNSSGLYQKDRKEIENLSFENEIIMSLDPTGAQVAVALGLAARFYKDGPRKWLEDPANKDRLIRVQKHFPNP